MGVPSARSPVLVIFTPPSDASLVVVRLLTGAAGLNFDFSMFSFHVPRELSAANATMAAIAKLRISFVEMLRIRLPLSFCASSFEICVGGLSEIQCFDPLCASGGHTRYR